MSEPKPSFVRRHPWLTGCGALILSVLGIVLFLAGRIHFMIAGRWTEFEARQAGLVARLKLQDGRREPLLGPPRPGNAWSGYGPALSDLEGVDPDEAYKVVWRMIRGKTQAEDLALLERCRDALGRIREAARCDQAQQDVDWATRTLSPPIGEHSPTTAAQFLAATAIEKWRAGSTKAGLDEVAAGLTLALDASRPPTGEDWEFLHLTRTLLQVLSMMVSDRAISAEDVERILDLVSRCERGLPSVLGIAEWCVARNLEPYRSNPDLARKLVTSGAYRPRPKYLRHLPNRFLVTDLASYQFALLDLASLPRSEWRTSIAKLHALFQDTDLPRVFAHPYNLDQMAENLRVARACLNLLKAGAMVRLGKNPSAPGWPVDPFNLKPVAMVHKDAVVSLRSVWTDGVESAKGSWFPEEDEDLVLEVPK